MPRVEEDEPLLPYGKGLINQDEPPQPAQNPPKKQRLVSLDAVRGLTVAVMIFVDQTGGALIGKVDHSPWDDVTFADFVMPFFLFMVGMSISVALRKYSQGQLQKVLMRTGKLFIIGLLTQGTDGMPGPGSLGYNLKTIRVPGILQRIAWTYFVVSLMCLYLPKLQDSFRPGAVGRALRLFRMYMLHWIVALCFLLVYIAIMFGLRVPSYNVPMGLFDLHVECDTSGDLTPKCSAARTVDMWILGYDHLYGGGEFHRLPDCSSCAPGDCPKADAPAWCFSRLDPEGILSSIPAVTTTFIGMHFGNALAHVADHPGRLWQWVPLSVIMWILGVVIHEAGWKMNKQLWSPSYLFMMAGSCGLMLSLFYCLMDFTDWQPNWLKRRYRVCGRWNFAITDVFRPFVWVGMNTMFIYLMSPAAGLAESLQRYIWWEHPKNNFVQAMFEHVFCKDSKIYSDYSFDGSCGGGMLDNLEVKYAWVIFTMVRIVFWFGVAGVLYRYNWFWAV